MICSFGHHANEQSSLHPLTEGQ